MEQKAQWDRKVRWDLMGRKDRRVYKDYPVNRDQRAKKAIQVCGVSLARKAKWAQRDHKDPLALEEIQAIEVFLDRQDHQDRRERLELKG